MASVAFKFTNQSKFQTNPPTVVDGQSIFVEGNEQGVGKIYLDFHNERRCYTPEYSGGGGGSEDPNAMKYKGISTTDPTTGTVTIGGSTYTPSPNDVVVYQDKEYLYRDDGNGSYDWFELGDENRPIGEISWDVDED